MAKADEVVLESAIAVKTQPVGGGGGGGDSYTGSACSVVRAHTEKNDRVSYPLLLRSGVVYLPRSHILRVTFRI